MGDIMIARTNTTQKAIERIEAFYAEVIRCNKPRTVVDIISELGFLLYADHIALGALDGLIDHLDEMLCLSGTLMPNNQRYHYNLLLCI